MSVEKYAKTAASGLLVGFCHLRQARRPFHFSRIQLAADSADGTVIEDLSSWLAARYDRSPNGVRDTFVRKNESALGALFFVAKADGAFDAKEKVVMRSFCASQGLTDIAAQVLVVELIASWVVPSRVAFGNDLRALLARDEHYRLEVLQHAQAIVAAGKSVREEETRALQRMSRELKLPAEETP